MSSGTRTFVVGIDASDDANDALQWARRVAAADDRIVVVHAWDIPSLIGLDSNTMIPAGQISTLAEQGLAELVQRHDDDRLVPVAEEGHAGRVIVEQADRHDADVVVVGHQGSGGAAVVLGSTANHVVHHTKRPVVVVRGGHRAAPELVVVGADDHDVDADGENESVRALRWAYSLHGVREIRVVHSWFVPSVAAGRFSNPGADFEAMDRAAIEVAEHVIAAAGSAPSDVTITAQAASGTPEFALIEASATADLVVIGSRGRGGFARLLLGSTSVDLAAYSHCPVAILR